MVVVVRWQQSPPPATAVDAPRGHDGAVPPDHDGARGAAILIQLVRAAVHLTVHGPRSTGGGSSGSLSENSGSSRGEPGATTIATTMGVTKTTGTARMMLLSRTKEISDYLTFRKCDVFTFLLLLLLPLLPPPPPPLSPPLPPPATRRSPSRSTTCSRRRWGGR